MSARAVTLALFIAVLVACSSHSAAAMNGQLRFFKEANVQSLRSIIHASASDLCYDMPCSTLSASISSVQWAELPTTGTAYADGQARIAFYKGANCTGKAAVVKTSAGKIPNFAAFGMDNAVSSFAVLETSKVMKHKTVDVCKR